MSKAGDFAEYAEAAGWEVAREIDGEFRKVTATRGSELIYCYWDKQGMSGSIKDGRWFHKVGDARIPVKNSAHARRIVDQTPAEAAASVPKKHRSGRRRGNDVNLPFDPAQASDKDIWESIKGRRIYWTNQHTDIPETALVPKTGRRVFIDSDMADLNGDPGMRILTFCDQAYPNRSGFRSLYVAALTSIGGME